MTKLLIASNNPGKIAEVTAILTDFSVVTPSEVGIPKEFDPEETGTTFEENSLIKAQAFAEESGLLSLADDSGLEVDALDGRPGVYSKRYGDDDAHRNQKLLSELTDVPVNKRTARFVCAMTIYDPATKKHTTVRGTVEGKIATKIKGKQGFGYDPVFIPDEIPGDQTFSELGVGEKNKISHRARALEKIKQTFSK